MYRKKPSGAGVSLRNNYFAEFLQQPQPVDWLEIVADQYLNSKGILIDKLCSIAKDYPTNLHCVAFSIAGTDPIDQSYLTEIIRLKKLLQPTFVSDHLCWALHQGQYSNDLLPFPYRSEFLQHIAARIQYIQEKLQCPLLLENLSHYMPMQHCDLSEAEFLNELCKITGCGILLDINNVFVSATNIQYNPVSFIDKISKDRVQQIHLAGHTRTEQRLVDTHSDFICQEVWRLYQHALQRFGAVPTCFEWDMDLPSWQAILKEVANIKNVLQEEWKPNCSKMKNIGQLHLCLDKDSESESLQQYQNKLWKQITAKTTIPDSNPATVHQYSIRMQRVQAMQNIYPCTQHCLGKEIFIDLALQFLSNNPAYSADVSIGMEKFPTFLEIHSSIAKTYLYDLANYELAWYQVFHNQNHHAIDLQKLATMIKEHGEDIILQQSTGCKLLKCTTPAANIWEACQSEYKGPDIYAILQNDISEYYYVLQQRQGYVLTTGLSTAAYLFLSLLDKPHSLQKWCELAAEHDNFTPNYAAQFYQTGLIEILQPEGT